MSIVNKFADYYQVRSLAAAERLWAALNNLDVADLIDYWDELFALRTQISQPPESSHRYPIAPHGYWWLRNVEFANKFPDGRVASVMLKNTLTWGIETCRLRYSDYELEPEIWIIANRFASQRPLDLLKEFRHRYALRCDPEVLLYWGEQPAFVDFINQRQIPIITTGHEAFYKQSRFQTHLNDCLVDWQTGFNFYRCRYNQYHCLPIFARVGALTVSLINLTLPQVPLSDHCEFGESERCACGRNRVQFEFVPHARRAMWRRDGSLLYAPAMAECLTKTYQNLQFVQHNERIDVLYVSDDPGIVDDAWRDFFLAQGITEFKLFPDHYWLDRGKRYVFHGDRGNSKYIKIGDYWL